MVILNALIPSTKNICLLPSDLTFSTDSEHLRLVYFYFLSANSGMPVDALYAPNNIWNGSLIHDDLKNANFARTFIFFKGSDSIDYCQN